MKKYKVGSIEEWAKLLQERTSGEFTEQMLFLIDYYKGNSRHLRTLKDLLDLYIDVRHQEANGHGMAECFSLNTTEIPEEIKKMTQKLYESVYKRQEKHVVANYRYMVKEEIAE